MHWNTFELKNERKSTPNRTMSCIKRPQDEPANEKKSKQNMEEKERSAFSKFETQQRERIKNQ